MDNIRKQIFLLLKKKRIIRIQYIIYNSLFLVSSFLSIAILILNYKDINYVKYLFVSIPAMFIFLTLSFIMFFKLNDQAKRLKLLRDKLLEK